MTLSRSTDRRMTVSRMTLSRSTDRRMTVSRMTFDSITVSTITHLRAIIIIQNDSLHYGREENDHQYNNTFKSH
jgi:hypothetical protein